MTWEMAEDMASRLGSVSLLTGHRDTLAKGSRERLYLHPAAAYQRGSYPRRVLSWLHYLAQAFLWLWRWPRQTPLLLFSNPPLLPWLGYLMRRLRGQRYAVMVHDIYPDLLVRLGMLSGRHPVARVWNWLNRRAYENADVVMTLGEYMAANLAKQFDPAQTKHGSIKVIYPWANTDVIRPLPKEQNWFAQKYAQLGKMSVMYSGNMGLGHDIETILAAAKQLQSEPYIHFMFLGAGPKWKLVQEEIRTHGLSNVTLLPWQPEQVVPYSLATADVAVVSLEETLVGLAVPSKAFFSLAAGTPLVLISGQQTEIGDLIKRFHCGWIIRPSQVNELVTILLSVRPGSPELALLKARSRAAAETVGARTNSVDLVNLANGMFAAS